MTGRFLKMVCLLLLFIACKKSSSKGSVERYIGNDRLIIQKTFENISTEGNNRFLVFSKDLCRKCFRQIIDHFEQEGKRGQVILMGANDYDIKRLNSIYHNSLKFWKGDFKQYQALLAQYPNMIRVYVRYVEINSDTLIYEGRGENRSEKINDVLKFFVERDRADD